MQKKIRRAGSVRVSAWLIGLALVPMSGAGWFALGELRDVNQDRQHAHAVAEAANELVELTELQAAVLSEGQFAALSAGAVSLGLDNEVVIDFVGIDLAADLAEARRRVDRIADEVAPASILERLASARRLDDSGAARVSNSYKAVDTDVHRRGEAVLERLLLIAGQSEDAGEVVASVRALENATVARRAIGYQFLGQFGMQFTETGHATSALADMVVGVALYDGATADLLREGTASDEVRGLLADIRSSDPYRTLRDTVDALVAAGLIDGARHPEPTLESVLPHIQTIADQITAGFEAVDRHLQLVVVAADDVVTAADALEHAADAKTDRAVLTIAILLCASVAFALAVTMAIGRPLGRLAESARRLSAGDSSYKVRPSGPREIRDAARALNGAVDNFAWAERQALALAAGRLDDPVLAEGAPGTFSVSLQAAVATLTSTLAEREEFRRRLSHEASHDSLTQVANRRAVMANLERSLARTHRSAAQLAVMFIDLDGFKGVNDLEGHAVGDEVLAAVARRLVTSVRQGDQVGRVGGDEFVVVAEPVAGVDDALRLAERIRDRLAEPIAAGEVSVSVGASIGIAIVDADSDLDADELLRDADLAVYKAKGIGRGQIVVCDEELRAELEQRADMEHSLRNALARDELTVHYQPIVGSAGDQVVALEALVRWERPGLGLVPPDAFIPHAERTELIVDVDRWVLDAVARQMHEWADHEVLGELPVAVNVSARHLGRPDFVDGVLGALAAYDVSPHRLVIEVTESAVLHDLHHAAWALQSLRTHGIQVAIDDFGTGYTSLSHLRALPVDILKIDRSFTSDPGAASLVQLIIDTGHLLGARVTSEGIETAEQASSLSDMGSDELQGFLYGRPVPAGELEAVCPVDAPRAG